MTSRGMIKRTFLSKGLSYVFELALQNAKDLLEILKWNQENNIFFFRISSDLFPWMSEYQLTELPNFKEIELALQAVGEFAKSNNHRLTFHPGPFNKLASDKEDVLKKTLKELDQHSEVFDIMGFSPSFWNKVNIHIGGAYGDKEATAKRFCSNHQRLSENTRKRLTVENDDRASLFSTKDLYEMTSSIKIPIVHDFHHHSFCTGGLNQEEALRLAISTWGDVKPVTHYSESRSIEKNDPKIRSNAHSDFVHGPVETYGLDVDIMIEAKMKEQALFELRKNNT